MKRTVCHYLMTPSGRLPAEEFIKSLSLKTRLKFFTLMKLLEDYGRRPPMPHAKYLSDGIFELRFHGNEGPIRIFYFFHGTEEAVFTNGFIKKAQKTPRTEFETARKRKEQYLG